MSARRNGLCLSLLLGVALLAASSFGAEPPRQVVVATDGSGTFVSIQKAVDSVTDATEKNPVDIVIKPGTYEGEMVTTKDWVNIVGTDRDKCILIYTRKPEEPAHTTHVIWATSNSVVRNLTLVGKDVKYCIHTDGGGSWLLRVENCILKREYLPGAKGYDAAFGIGLHAGQHVVVRDCRLEADTPILMRNSPDQTGSSDMTVERCVLLGKTRAVVVSMLGSRQRDFLVIHDSTLKGDPVAIVYNVYDMKTAPFWKGNNEFEIYGSGNKIEAPETGAVIKDDSADRMTGIELFRKFGSHNSLAKPGVRLQEEFGRADAPLKESAVWHTGKPPQQFALKSEVTADALVLTFPEGKDPFAYAGGAEGAYMAQPMVFELRMKCSFAEKGRVELYYCCAPHVWTMFFTPGQVADAANANAKAALKVDTGKEQLYRVVARSPEDVRLYVEGADPAGIPIKAASHTVTYMQMRLIGPGTQVTIRSTLISGDLPPERK